MLAADSTHVPTSSSGQPRPDAGPPLARVRLRLLRALRRGLEGPLTRGSARARRALGVVRRAARLLRARLQPPERGLTPLAQTLVHALRVDALGHAHPVGGAAHPGEGARARGPSRAAPERCATREGRGGHRDGMRTAQASHSPPPRDIGRQARCPPGIHSAPLLRHSAEPPPPAARVREFRQLQLQPTGGSGSNSRESTRSSVIAAGLRSRSGETVKASSASKATL